MKPKFGIVSLLLVLMSLSLNVPEAQAAPQIKPARRVPMLM